MECRRDYMGLAGSTPALTQVGTSRHSRPSGPDHPGECWRHYSNLVVAGSNPAVSSPERERRVAQSGRAHEPCRRSLSLGPEEGEQPGECRQDYRLERRGNPEGRSSTLRTEQSVSSWKDVLPSLSPDPNTGANAEGTTAQLGKTCGVQAPSLRAAIGAAGGPIVSSPLSPRS